MPSRGATRTQKKKFRDSSVQYLQARSVAYEQEVIIEFLRGGISFCSRSPEIYVRLIQVAVTIAHLV